MSSHISSGETVKWTGRVSHLCYFGRWLLVLLLLAAAAASFCYEPAERFEQIWIARGALLIAAMMIVIWIQAARIQRRYTVTDHRIIVEYGVVSKRSNDIRIQDVRSINLEVKGLLGMLGVGRLEFSSAATDDAEVIFWNAPHAEKVRDLVRSLQSLPAPPPTT